MIAAADSVLPILSYHLCLSDEWIDADNLMQESAHHNLKLSQIATFPLHLMSAPEL